jgi:hypothetical protein
MEEVDIDEVKRTLQAIRSRPIRTAEEARVAAEALKALASLLRAEERARRLTGVASGGLEGPTASASQSRPLHEVAEEVLRRAGVPLHAKELADRIYASGWRHPRPPYQRPDRFVAQVTARLSKHDHRDAFRRVGPNTFALAEWGPQTPERPRRKPRLPLFSSGQLVDGQPISRWIGDHPDAPFEDENAAWRSS